MKTTPTYEQARESAEILLAYLENEFGGSYYTLSQFEGRQNEFLILVGLKEWL